MKRKSVVVVLLSLVLVVGFAAVTIPAISGIPVQGAFTGQIERTQISTSPPAWSVRVTGPVQIVGIGAGTAEIVYDRVELAADGNNLLPGDTEGTGTVTLATGDKVFGTFRWLTSPTADANVLNIVGTITVTGGTGPFENATGSGVAVGQGNVAANQVTLSLNGFLEDLEVTTERTRRPRLGP